MTLQARMHTMVALVLATALGCSDDGATSGRLDQTMAGATAAAPAAGAPAGATAAAPAAGTMAGVPAAAAGTTAAAPAGTIAAGTTEPAVAECGNDPAAAGDEGCPAGLLCANPTGTGAVCLCPGSMAIPACTVGGTECDAFAGTSCLLASGVMGCLLACTPPGQMAVQCPAGTVCMDTFGMGAFCADSANAQGFPPMCTLGGTECAAFAGTACSDIGGLVGCWLSCVVGSGS